MNTSQIYKTKKNNINSNIRSSYWDGCNRALQLSQYDEPCFDLMSTGLTASLTLDSHVYF